MIDFGYTIQRNRQIDFDANSVRILDYIRKEEPSIDLCISCGTCSSGCTAGASTEYSLCRLILLVRRGEEAEMIDSVNRCRFCGKCMIACPRNVNTRNIIYFMQMAVNKICNHEF